MKLMRIVLLLVGLMVPQVHAQQMGFATNYIGNEVEFAYVWTARDGKSESLRFRLPIEDLQRGAVEFRGFDQQAVQEAINKAVQAEVEKMDDPDGVRVKLRPVLGRAMRLEISGYGPEVSQAYLDEIKQRLHGVKDEVEKAYMDEHWLTVNGDDMILPDHPRLVRRYAPALAPVVQAIRAQTAGRSEREVIDYVMGWLQTIPYDTLTSRYSTAGAGGGMGYQTPYGLILNNKGDCDTKSVALLAIVRALYPTLPLAMIYVPNHAFAGIGIPQGGQDYALRLSNAIVVLADPTGPHMSKLGEVEPRAKAVLRENGGWHLAI